MVRRHDPSCRNWPQEKDRIRPELPSGRYRFGLLERVALANGDEIDLWSVRDALVMKALAITLSCWHRHAGSSWFEAATNGVTE